MATQGHRHHTEDRSAAPVSRSPRRILWRRNHRLGLYLYEWTWQSHICFVYNRFSLRPVRQLRYTGEGWGMTRTDKEIITSDGTATLRFRDPETFKETRHIVVRDGSKPIFQLNELEYIKGEIYANVWHSDQIVRISLETDTSSAGSTSQESCLTTRRSMLNPY